MSTVISKTIKYVGSTINAVDPLKWFYVPMLIVFIICMIISFALVGVDVNAPIESNSCTGEGVNKVCKSVKRSGLFKVLIAILLSGVFSGFIGKGTYMVGLSIYNPKATAGIVDIGAVKDALFD